MGLSALTAKAAAIISAIGTAILVAVVAYALHTIVVGRLTTKHENALKAQKTALIAECNSDKSLTKGTDDAIYNNHTAIDDLLSDRLRGDTGTCIAITLDPIGPTTPVAAKGIVHDVGRQGNGVSKAELYRKTAEADKILSDLYECRSFIENTWKAKGQ